MRIAMFGGSFNPIHRGHIEIVRAVREMFSLDRVLIMVANDPPHKQIADGVSAAHRLEMTRIALEGIEGLEACDLELRRPGKSYTVDTLGELHELYPDAELYCMIGADMLLTLDTWHNAPELFRRAKFIAVGRPDSGSMEAAAEIFRREYGADITISGITGPDISSTMVRTAVEMGEDISHLVTDGVAEYIYRHGFYLTDEVEAIRKRLQQELGQKRYEHTMGVVRMAAELTSMCGADGKKAQLAALLHDCAKLSWDKQQSMADEYGIDISDMHRPIVHGPVGAERARREFGVTDAEILSAIDCHSVCKPGMGILDKIVYLADKIEHGRSYEGLEGIRQETEKSLDHGVIACIEHGLGYLKERGEHVHPNTLLALEELKNKNREA
ncbi:MAG: nicotinate-nucleotide adenylyltransferase [Clostridia bacterium]|nr:nicotinate-nucleotide adenylyltransferase [Clostridia bacterium]